MAGLRIGGKPHRGEPPRTLVLGPAWIGDMVIANALFQRIKSLGNTQLDVMAPAWTRPLLERMPEVDRALETPFEHGKLQFTQRIQMARRARNQHYQWAIVLPNSWKSALVPFLAGIPKRTGYLGEQRWGLLNDIRTLEPDQLPQMAQRYLALVDDKINVHATLEDLPRPALTVCTDDTSETARAFSLDPQTAPLVLCPGAEFGPSKQWPEVHYAQVAKHFLGHGFEVWLMGSAADMAAASRINAVCAGRCRDLCGQTDLSQAIDLLSLARLVVCNDSGLMHIAAALGRPLVAIYGSTDPKHTPPMSPAAAILERNDLPCRPCFERTCPLEHLDCLRGLKPNDVIDAALNLLNG